jgi:zinc protease
MRAKHILGRAAFALLLLTFVSSLGLSDANAAKKPWEKFRFDDLGDVTIPDYERHVLPNGLTVYLLEDHTWPLIDGRMLIRTGGAFEPASQVGLASVMGDVLRTGGSNKIAADDLDAELERMGAYIESGIDDTSGSVSFSFLREDIGRGLELLGDVVRDPAFEQEKIDVALTGLRASVARRNDDLNGIVAREMRRAVWGPDHPYARNVEYSSIDAIDRDSIVQFYEYFFVPDNMSIAVWGDFDAASMLGQIEDQFGDWEAGDPTIPDLPNEPQETARRRVMIANKEDVTQARIHAGQIGMRADDVDYYAMSVANRVLGGSFGSKLFNEVRTNQGLAYNVGSRAGVDFEAPGVFQAYVGTKSSTAEKALGVMLETVEKMREEPVTSGELEDAKDAILNSNVFNYVSTSQVLNRKITLEYLGYPEDFLETYNEKIRAVDAGAVLDVMQRRVDPDNFAIVAVGKTDEWDGDLSDFGPVEDLDISIPEPEGPEFPDPTDESVEAGRGVLAAAQRAHGGAALSSMSSLERKDTVGLSVNGMEMSISTHARVVFPVQAYTQLKLPFGEMVQCVNGETGWSKSPQGTQSVGGDQLADMRNDIIADPLYILGHFDAFPVQQLPGEEINGQAADVVLVWVNDKDEEWKKLYFEPQSHLLLGTQAKGDNPITQAAGIQDTYVSDYREVDGIKVPFAATLMHDGEKLMEIETTLFSVNPVVDASIFEQPAS